MMTTSRKYSVIDVPPVSKERLAAIRAIADSEIDFSDIPLQTKSDFDCGHFAYDDTLELQKKC